jgi:hypothetical protein
LNPKAIMKLIAGLLLGSAAGIVAMTVARAGDLPSGKSSPVAYAKICDAYGAGFFFIPGSDTCLRVGGYARAEYAYLQRTTMIAVPRFMGNLSSPAALAPNPKFAPASAIDSTTGFTANGRVELDARTPTPLGDVRVFISVRGQTPSTLIRPSP